MWSYPGGRGCAVKRKGLDEEKVNQILLSLCAFSQLGVV
jgi:hypothetical protein